MGQEAPQDRTPRLPCLTPFLLGVTFPHPTPLSLTQPPHCRRAGSAGGGMQERLLEEGCKWTKRLSAQPY